MFSIKDLKSQTQRSKEETNTTINDQELCFHFIKMRYLDSIRKKGLVPIKGENCYLICDDRTPKVSYSIGSTAALKMMNSFYEIYLRIQDGRINEDTFNEEHKQLVKRIQESNSFEEWAEDGVYLIFNRDSIESDTMRDEAEPHDAWTNGTIPAKALKVCVIRDKSRNGKIVSYSKYDIASFIASRQPERHISFFAIDHEDEIEKYKNPKYEIDYLDIDRFYEFVLNRKKSDLEK